MGNEYVLGEVGSLHGKRTNGGEVPVFQAATLNFELKILN
jgi:hypothetical protein